MSRAPIHRRRRIWWLWTPIAAIAAGIYLLSFTYTLTINGLGLAALIVAFGAGAAITKEATTWNS